MGTIALIACSKQKADTLHAIPAHRMYTGRLFQAQLAYARQVLKLDDKNIFILSAKHGLLRVDQNIFYYQKSLAEMSAAHRDEWSGKVAKKLAPLLQPEGTVTVYLLAGRLYREAIEWCFQTYDAIVMRPVPAGLGYAQQVNWLLEEIKRKRGNNGLPKSQG